MAQFFMNYLPNVLVIILIAQQCRAANIIFMVYHDKGSHFQSVLPMMEKLANRGHSVSVLDTMFPKDQHPSIRHIRAQLPILPYDQETRLIFADILWHRRLNSALLAYVYYMANLDFGNLITNHSKQVTGILNTDWDLLVVDDIFWSFGYALATLKHRLWEQNGGKEPRIVVYGTAGTSLTCHNSIRSLGRNWLGRTPMAFYLPTDESDVFSPSDHFIHRVYAFYEIISEFFAINFIVENFLMWNIAKFGVPKFTWHELYSRAHLSLHESIDRMGLSQSTGSEMVTVGANCKNPSDLSTLPKQFIQFMEDSAYKGTIYIAFGTHVDWKYAPKHVLDAFNYAFRQLTDYRVIFACKECELATDLGKHVLIVKWVPQLELLAHPSIKVFITHGGFKSVREGICAGTPLIVMPILAEQAHNAHYLLKTRLASAVINKFSVTGPSLLATIKKVVSQPELLTLAKRHRTMFLDRPIPSMDHGVYAMERLLADRSSKWVRFTQRKGMHLGWMEYAYLDAATALILIIFFVSK